MLKKVNVHKFVVHWDSFCQHGNVLFRIWHRFFCLRLEHALQTVFPDGEVALHYWDGKSIPKILTQKEVLIDGVVQRNSLLDLVISRGIGTDPQCDFTKPYGYQTVRCPYSGIVGKMSKQHNESVKEKDEEYFPKNLEIWMHEKSMRSENGSVSELFKSCLENDNYNTFSNNKSAGDDIALEQPHDNVHIAVAGWGDLYAAEDDSPQVDDPILYKIQPIIEIH